MVARIGSDKVRETEISIDEYHFLPEQSAGLALGTLYSRHTDKICKTLQC